MNTPKDESNEDAWFWMSAKQRHEQRYKIWIVVYFLGCALLYFGIPQLLVDSLGTNKLTYQPDKDIFLTLFNAVVELTRPVAAVFLCGIPVMATFGLWVCCHGFYTKYRKNQ